jgi:hypothetical protein
VGFPLTSIRAKAMSGKELLATGLTNPVGNLIRTGRILLACVFAASFLLAGCSAGSSSSSPGPGPLTHSVTLTWDPSSSPSVVGYNVFRSTQSGGPYALVNSSRPVSTLTYTDMSVQAGKTYYYVLTAVGGNGVESPFSGEVAATIPSP